MTGTCQPLDGDRVFLSRDPAGLLVTTTTAVASERESQTLDGRGGRGVSGSFQMLSGVIGR